MTKVLILDDEVDIVSAMAEAFEYAGHEPPDVVTTAEEAMRMMGLNEYRLVVIDAKLSGRISGIDVIRFCRGLPALPRIFAMSGITRTDFTEILKKEGVMDMVEKVLEKPVDIQPRDFVLRLERMGLV